MGFPSHYFRPGKLVPWVSQPLFMFPVIPGFPDLFHQTPYHRYVCLWHRSYIPIGKYGSYLEYEKLLSRPRSSHSWIQKNIRHLAVKTGLSQKSTVLLLWYYRESTTKEVNSETAQPDEVTSTSSWSAPSMPPVSTTDRLLGDWTSENTIILPLQNPPPTTNTAKTVAGGYSSRSDYIYKGMALRVSEKLGNQPHARIDTKIEGGMRQQVDALLPAVLEWEIQPSLRAAWKDWIAWLVRKMAQVIEKVAPTSTK